MDKTIFIRKLLQAGDGYANYTGADSNKSKYCICTLDFKTPYIRDAYKTKYKREPPTTAQQRKSLNPRVLVFSWDINDFRHIVPEKVTSITPLSDVINNELR